MLLLEKKNTSYFSSMGIYVIPLAINKASKVNCSLFDKYTIFLLVSIDSILVLVRISMSPD